MEGLASGVRMLLKQNFVIKAGCVVYHIAQVINSTEHLM